MACSPAPACKAALSQATARWPNRSRRSDGICPSAAHTGANPTSDHELGNAVDLTHDLLGGCDAHAWAESLRVRRDRRVSYIISRGQIVSSYPVAGWPAWAWRPYSGPNPHTTHAHVSIKPEFRGDASAWFVEPAPPVPSPLPVQIQEDDMLICGDGTSAWLLSGGTRTWIESPTELAALRKVLPYVEAPALVARTPISQASV